MPASAMRLSQASAEMIAIVFKLNSTQVSPVSSAMITTTSPWANVPQFALDLSDTPPWRTENVAVQCVWLALSRSGGIFQKHKTEPTSRYVPLPITPALPTAIAAIAASVEVDKMMIHCHSIDSRMICR